MSFLIKYTNDIECGEFDFDFSNLAAWISFYHEMDMIRHCF